MGLSAELTAPAWSIIHGESNTSGSYTPTRALDVDAARLGTYVVDVVVLELGDEDRRARTLVPTTFQWQCLGLASWPAMRWTNLKD
jgi:hypothetical protein